MCIYVHECVYLYIYIDLYIFIYKTKHGEYIYTYMLIYRHLYIGHVYEYINKCIYTYIQSGLGMPDRDYYFDADKEDKRVAYLKYIEDLFVLLGSIGVKNGYRIMISILCIAYPMCFVYD
jgi:hypothetical protein